MADPTTVFLPEILDFRAAAPLCAQLLQQRGRPLTLDASKVRRLGGLCAQVLLSAQATWAADGVALNVEQPSPALVNGLATLGASPFPESMDGQST